MLKPDAENVIAARLEADRRNLLDLSLRNPLLNFVPRSKSLEFVGESASQVFRTLVRERKAMTFQALPDKKSQGAEASPEDPELLGRRLASRDDSRLQTALAAEPLRARLLSIFYAARTSIEEQGANSLFLALGMLHWTVPDQPGRRLQAPLILVPVELERSNARERFRLRYTDDEVEVNLSLAEKLRTDHAIELPEGPEADGWEFECYLEEIDLRIRDQEGWEVDRDSVMLGFFSFSKFLMYRDLDDAVWPEGSRPSSHPILRALLDSGFREPEPEVGEDEAIDPHVAPADSFQVVDADSSQTLAILDVNRGRNLVIQGPPGTGKSQTITNLLAEALGRGRTVLFVSEKLAALEVVKQRLDRAGLGDACLELHSHRTSKKALLDELRRTLALGKPKLGPIDDDLQILSETRDRLNAYCEALKGPIGDSDLSPFQVIGELIRLGGLGAASLPLTIDLPSLPSWTRYERKRRLALVEELQARVADIGVPGDHPFWGSGRTVFLPAEGERLRDLVLAAQGATASVRDAADQVARFLRLPAATARAEAELLLRAAKRVTKGAQRLGAGVASGDWLARRGEIQELLDAGTALAKLHLDHDQALLPEAWDQDLLEVRGVLNVVGRRWWRDISPTYRKASQRVGSLCREAPPSRLEGKLELVDAVLSAARHREVLRRNEALASSLFGRRWQGERSKWEALVHLAEWVIQLHQDVRAGRLPSGILDFLASEPDVEPAGPLASALKAALAAHLEALRRLGSFLEYDPATHPGAAALEDARLDELETRLALWSRRRDDLPALVAFNQLAARCRAEGLAAVVEVAGSWPDAGRDLADAFRKHWYETLLGVAFRERPALATFDGQSHEHAIRIFGEYDRLALRHNRARLAAGHWERLPRNEGGGQVAVLRREFEKKTRHLPVRQLLARAGNAIQAIKPVFMMSPLSVAAHLAPGHLGFDLVIFDEASQVNPVDALGAILRGRQAVVVGDSRQLPPTNFFERLTNEDEADDEGSGDVESILGLFVSQGSPERVLRWHYRSRHESLIAVSNREFYDDRLIVFPSPDVERGEAGLTVRHLEGTSYDRGKTRTSAGEADAVARAVFAHARDQLARPIDRRLSLGVAAFSAAQTEAIRDRLEALRREDPSCEEFFRLDAPEPVFVKNLENVQGDERDVIFISVGYGRTADGELAMSFGPLNGDGGERRLNVLITRARIRCEVFTNLKASDIDLSRTRSRGVQALKTFLAYAEGGGLDARGAAIDEATSPFERSVADALSEAGCEVRSRIGPAGSALDMAIIDPDHPGRYLLGLECDGPAYQVARSARDRDRLRPQVLEGLGWRLRRVWSADWARNPSGALARLVTAVDEARRGGKTSDDAPGGTPRISPIDPPLPVADVESISYQREDPGGISGGDAPLASYRLASLNGELAGMVLEDAPTDRLAGFVSEVVRVESPVHIDEVVRRIAEAAGIKRLESKVRAVLETACSNAVDRGSVRRRGDFLWEPSMQVPRPRDRRALPAASRKLDLIADEELASAIERVIADSYGMTSDAIPAQAGRLLGFARVGEEFRGRIDSIVQTLALEKKLVARNGQWVVADSSD